MNSEITLKWINNVVGLFAFRQRVLASEAYACHMEDTVAEDLKRKKFDVVFIPVGCTKYIQTLTLGGRSHSRQKCKTIMTNGSHQLESTASQNLGIYKHQIEDQSFNGV